MEKTSIQVSLELLGDMFDVDYVTTLLNREPCYTLTKGEIIKRTKQKSCVTVWGISGEREESVDMDIQMNPIFDFIEQNVESFKLISVECQAEWRISADITIIDEHTPAMVLSPRQIFLANEIKATIDFDMYARQKCPMCSTFKL
ncbi:MAG: DUF4279 domain-containing protein [Defluviitaleaceae bacterium]|nr:DUF4279 domain-containing protein [Defluviitaleaceae bacterium]